MSAAKDEAENGPDLSSEDDVHGEESQEEDRSDQSRRNELSAQLLVKPSGAIGVEKATVGRESTPKNGIEEENLESEDSSFVQASRLLQGRPSSADGSLSIPDDTPSVQVSTDLY